MASTSYRLRIRNAQIVTVCDGKESFKAGEAQGKVRSGLNRLGRKSYVHIPIKVERLGIKIYWGWIWRYRYGLGLVLACLR